MFQSEWSTTYVPIFREFVTNQLEEFEPDWVILVPRKGPRVYLSMNLIPEKYLNRVVSGDAIDQLLATNLANKKIAIGDDVIQSGIQIGRYSQRLVDAGTDPDKIRAFCLSRFKPLYEKGISAYPAVNPRFDLEERDFRAMTAELSDFLLLQGRPLDVDHLIAKFDISNEQLKADCIGFATFLTRFGHVYIIPSPAEKNEILTITLDAPTFFSIKDELLPDMQPEGVSKIRFYYNADQGKVLCAPVIFPKLDLTEDSAERAKNICPHLGRIISVFDESTTVQDPVVKMRFVYESVCLFLASKFLSEFIIASRPYTRKETLEIPADDFLVNYGYALGFKLHKTISDIIMERVKGSVLKTIVAEDVPTANLKDLDVEAAATEITNLLQEVELENRKMNRESAYSFTEICKQLPRFDHQAISKAFDILLDRGLIKPQNEARQSTNGVFSFLRTYRIGENATPPAADSERRRLDKMVALLPVVLDRVRKDLRTDGVPSKYIYKVLVNLKHDWNTTRFGDLFLDFKPYLFGPIPNFPKQHDPYGGYYSLYSFGKKYKTSHFDEKRGLYIPRLSKNSESMLSACFEPEELDIALGLVEIYTTLHNAGGTELLTTLSACRNRYLAYLHAHKNITVWADEFVTLLVRLGAIVQGGDRVSSTTDEEVERLRTCEEQVIDKIRRYKELHETVETVQKCLSEHPRKALGLRIIESVEVPPKISDKGPNSLTQLEAVHKIIAIFTDLVTFSLGKAGVCSQLPKVKNNNDGLYYVEQLAGLLTADLEIYDQIRNLQFQSRADIDLLTKAFDPIGAVIAQLEEPLLQRPKDPEFDPTYKAYLGATSAVASGEERAIAFIDIENFVKLSSQMSRVLKEDDDQVREKMWTTVNDCIKDLREFFHPLHVVEVGGDGWMLTFTKADDAVRACVKLHKRLSELDSIIPIKTAINWGVPSLTGGGARDKNSIILYYILEKSGRARAGNLLVTSNFLDHISDPDIKSYCVSIEPVATKYFGNIAVSRVGWEQISI